MFIFILIGDSLTTVTDNVEPVLMGVLAGCGAGTGLQRSAAMLEQS